VLAGINIGGNLGVDVFHSGTVAAAREAALHGLPAIAISHHIRPGLELAWDRATDWLRPVLEDLLATPPPRGSFWNVNLPHRPPGPGSPTPVRCKLDTSPMPVVYETIEGGFKYHGNYHERSRVPGGDIAVCFEGNISLTLLET
jgi:5'-nucleotidase